MRVASKVGNPPSKFGQIIISVLKLFAISTKDGRTDKSNAIAPFPTGGGIITDRQKQCHCTLPYGRGHNNNNHHHQVARPAVSIAVSTTERHLERSCARSHAELRPKLVGCRSDSMVRSQIRRGRPLRRRQSVGRWLMAA